MGFLEYVLEDIVVGVFVEVVVFDYVGQVQCYYCEQGVGQDVV